MRMPNVKDILYDAKDKRAREELAEIKRPDELTRLQSENARLRLAVAKMSHRKCRDCGNVAYHLDTITPHVLCEKCGSQDTRLIREPERKPDA